MSSSATPPPPPGFVPMSSTPPVNPGSAQTPQPPRPAQDAIASSLSSPVNPGSAPEGTYTMHDSSGVVTPVRYSRVHQALDQGLLFTDKNVLQQYARDHAADPLDEGRVDQWIEKHPILSTPLKGLIGMGTGMLKTVTGLDRTPTTKAETALQLAAATPTKGFQEGGAEAGENLGEFFSGEELLGMLGKTGAAMSVADKLKAVTGLAQTVEKYPMIAKLLKIGVSAAKQGTIAGTQTLAKTGGDVGAAATAGATAAAAGPVMDIAGAGATALRTAIQGPVEEAAGKGAAEFADAARGAVRPQLEATNEARSVPQQEVMMNQPGGEPPAPTGRMVATATGKPAPKQIDVDQVLSQVHDFTGAADRLTAINDDAYNQFDVATNGRFRTLNAEVAAAQKAARGGERGAAELYQSKLGEMDALMDSTQGEISPEMKAAAKSGFRQSYMLRDFGNLWDRNLNGVPGASQASQTQRGINGRGLMKDLQRAVKMYHRPAVEESLGPGRLENLEAIAEANQTAVQRVSFNRGVHNVVRSMGSGAILGGAAGHFAGSYPAGAMVGAAATGAPETYNLVMNAIKTNPRIAQNFLFALQSGAKAERYGPFIATMIQKTMTDASNEQQQATASDNQ